MHLSWLVFIPVWVCHQKYVDGKPNQYASAGLAQWHVAFCIALNPVRLTFISPLVSTAALFSSHVDIVFISSERDNC